MIHREIDGVVYNALVKDKDEAKKDYDRAKKRGQSAGLVSQKYVFKKKIYQEYSISSYIITTISSYIIISIVFNLI